MSTKSLLLILLFAYQSMQASGTQTPTQKELLIHGYLRDQAQSPDLSIPRLIIAQIYKYLTTSLISDIKLYCNLELEQSNILFAPHWITTVPLPQQRIGILYTAHFFEDNSLEDRIDSQYYAHIHIWELGFKKPKCITSAYYPEDEDEADEAANIPSTIAYKKPIHSYFTGYFDGRLSVSKKSFFSPQQYFEKKHTYPVQHIAIHPNNESMVSLAYDCRIDEENDEQRMTSIEIKYWILKNQTCQHTFKLRTKLNQRPTPPSFLTPEVYAIQIDYTIHLFRPSDEKIHTCLDKSLIPKELTPLSYSWITGYKKALQIYSNGQLLLLDPYNNFKGKLQGTLPTYDPSECHKCILPNEKQVITIDKNNINVYNLDKDAYIQPKNVPLTVHYKDLEELEETEESYDPELVNEQVCLSADLFRVGALLLLIKVYRYGVVTCLQLCTTSSC